MLFFLILICLFIVFLYFAPSFIAISRKHTYVLQITLLNALLGWSFFGWAAALIWATTNHIDENVNTKLSWTIISIFLIAIIFPVILFSSIFTFSKVETEPQGFERVQYQGFYYRLKPPVIEKIDKNGDKIENKVEENKGEDKKKESADKND